MGSQRIWGWESNLRGYKQEYIFPAPLLASVMQTMGESCYPPKTARAREQFYTDSASSPDVESVGVTSLTRRPVLLIDADPVVRPVMEASVNSFETPWLSI
jgi:hypothetical protein